MASINSCKPLPDIDYLESVLEYDRERGLLLWRREKNPQWNGLVAGNKTPWGYQRIKLKRSLYLAHRIAWKLANGSDPGDFEVDHIDGNPQNNRPDNLRLATHGNNQCNGGPYSSNKSGYRGVFWSKPRKRYVAAIQHEKVRVKIGVYSSATDAAAAYNEKAKELFGEFAKLNILRGD